MDRRTRLRELDLRERPARQLGLRVLRALEPGQSVATSSGAAFVQELRRTVVGIGVEDIDGEVRQSDHVVPSRVEIGIQETRQGCSLAAAKVAVDIGAGRAPAGDLARSEPVDQPTDEHRDDRPGALRGFMALVAKCRFVVLSPIDA